MKVYYEVTRGCTFCNTCVYECPAGAISMTREGAKIGPERCTGCGRCAENCASDAIVRVSRPRHLPKQN